VSRYKAISCNPAARAALIKDAKFREAVKLLGLSKSESVGVESHSESRVTPLSADTPIRTDSSRTRNDDPLETVGERTSPVESVPSDVTPAGSEDDWGVDDDIDASSEDYSDGELYGSEAQDFGDDPEFGSVPGMAGEDASGVVAERARGVVVGPAVEELARQLAELALPSDDPEVLAERAARCLAAGLEIASDLPDPEFTRVIETHYRKLQRIRDLGSRPL